MEKKKKATKRGGKATATAVAKKPARGRRATDRSVPMPKGKKRRS